MKLRILFPSVLLAIVAGLIAVTLRYPYKSMLFPLLVAVPVAVLLAVDVLREVQARQKSAPARRESVTGSGITPAAHLTVAAWFIAFAIIIHLCGFLLGAPLYLILYLKLHREGWLTTIVYVAAITLFIYVVFEKALGISMYKGIFFE